MVIKEGNYGFNCFKEGEWKEENKNLRLLDIKSLKGEIGFDQKRKMLIKKIVKKRNKKRKKRKRKRNKKNHEEEKGQKGG